MVNEKAKKGSLLGMGLVVFSLAIELIQTGSTGMGTVLAVVGLVAVVASQYFHIESDELIQIKGELEELRRKD